jgi:hypothetical protein
VQLWHGLIFTGLYSPYTIAKTSPGQSGQLSKNKPPNAAKCTHVQAPCADQGTSTEGGPARRRNLWGERRFPFSFRLTVSPPLQGWFIICRHPRAASARRPQEKTRTPGPQNVAAFEIGFDLSRSFHHRSLSLPQIIQGGGGRLSNLNLILLAIAMSSFNTVFDQHNYFVWPNSTTLGTTFESADTIDAIFITNHSPAYVSSNCSCNGFKSYFTYATPSTSFTFGGTYVHRT